MLEALKVRIKQGRQFIPDVTKAVVNNKFRGLPRLDAAACENCGECGKVCPTGAVHVSPLSIDMGKCVFCGECALICPKQAIAFTNYHKLAVTDRGDLIVTGGIAPEQFSRTAVKARKEIRRLFGRSLKLRSVSAGGCNACEMEVNASSNVNFDMGRFGIDVVASPRHADGIIITGPISENMAEALEITFDAVPDPRIVIAAGTCAISGGVFRNSPALNRRFFEKHRVDIYIPGCPAHPLSIINGILAFLGHN